MSSLIPKGSEASRLHNAFEQAAAEALAEQNIEQAAAASEAITAEAETSGSFDPELLPSAFDLRQYRAARRAEESLIVGDPQLAESGEGSMSDYRKAREAEQRGERPRSYRDYIEGR